MVRRTCRNANLSVWRREGAGAEGGGRWEGLGRERKQRTQRLFHAELTESRVTGPAVGVGPAGRHMDRETLGFHKCRSTGGALVNRASLDPCRAERGTHRL